MKNYSTASGLAAHARQDRFMQGEQPAVSTAARHYKLRCQACGNEIEDDGRLLACPAEHAPTLLLTEYADAEFEVDEQAEGLYRYHRWLPLTHTLDGAGRTVTYKSEELCRRTGLTNLWIAFNGYWPEKGAGLKTATFKELEAYAVLARLNQDESSVLVVASAGNTAAAFAHVCSEYQSPCLIVIPQAGMARMKFSAPLAPSVKLVSVTGFSDYYDAIQLAERVSRCEGFIPEGGVKNVARRDGIGTTMLNAVETMGHLPEYYFQAVGSGTGGIAVHDAARKLIDDGRFGQRFPRQMLSQNLPFVPLYLSWKTGRREMLKVNREEGKRQIQQIAANVLSNMQPPYGVQGGVFDILTESLGEMFVADNEEALAAARLFEECEGIDIDPAAGIALATLLKAASEARIERDASILLHVTGGGWTRRNADEKLFPARPDLEVNATEVTSDETLDQVLALFR